MNRLTELLIKKEQLRQQASEKNSRLDAYEKAAAKREELEKRQGKIENLKERLQAAKQADAAAKMEERYLVCQSEWQQNEEERSVLKKELEDLIQKQSAAQTEAEKNQWLFRLEEVRELFEEAEQRKKDLEEKKQQTIQAQNLSDRAAEEFQQKNRLFIAVQAGILASSLSEGIPCPVCGSLTHPKKAKLKAGDVTGEEVEQARKFREKREDELRKAAEESHKAEIWYQTQFDQAKNAEKRLEEEIGQSDFFAEKQNREFLTGVIDNHRRNSNGDGKKSENRVYYKEEAARAEALSKRLKEEMTVKEGYILSKTEKNERLKKQAEESKKNWEFTWKKEGFSSEMEYREAKLDEQEKENLQQELRDFERECLENETLYREYAKLTKGEKRTEEEPLLLEISELKKEKECLEAECGFFQQAKVKNELVFHNTEQLLKEKADWKQKKQLIQVLYETADGKVSGTVRMDFQTYIQRRYFKQMIAAANRRLAVMTDGSFLLRCKEIDKLSRQGEAGLDLDVYSLVSDQLRDVKTLSGGEAFMAALSMALGMADVIQNTAGSVRVEAMFIDEGFGSLDDDSRIRAVRILNELAGSSRMIGIISHVTELKEQIGRKLVIKKGESGSQAEWILDD